MENGEVTKNSSEEKAEIKVKPVFVAPDTEVKLSSDIDSLVYKNYLDNQIRLSGLLGKYDENGKYSISKEIMQELVAMQKTMQEVAENTYSVRGEVDNFVLNMSLQIITNTEARKKQAILRLHEKAKAFSEEFVKKHVSFVASYSDFDDIYFFTKVKKVFNLYEDEQPNSKDLNKELAKGILERLKELKESVARLEKEDSVNKEYVDLIIKLMGLCGEEGKFVIRRFSTMLEQSKLSKDSSGYYFRARTILDEILLLAGIKLAPNHMEILAKIQKSMVDNDASAKAPKVVAVKEAAKPAKKPASKAAAAKKPAKKSAAKAKKKDSKIIENVKKSGVAKSGSKESVNSPKVLDQSIITNKSVSNFDKTKSIFDDVKNILQSLETIKKADESLQKMLDKNSYDSRNLFKENEFTF